MYCRALLSVVALSMVVSLSRGNDTSCPPSLAKCSCNVNLVNCDQTHLGSLSPQLSFDARVTYFYYDEMNLTEITADHFVNYPGMTVLSLRKNQINRINGKTFNQNKKLVTLHLSYNKLTYIPKHLFRGLSKLANLYLDHNKLARIESEHLMHLDSLVEVRVESNELTFLGKDAFINSPGLKSLYLEDNLLEIPQKEWFAEFNKHADYEIYLDGNEWSCDCRMKDFYNWTMSHHWFVKHDGDKVALPHCKYPRKMRNVNLKDITDLGELTCTGVTLTSLHNAGVFNVVEGSHFRSNCSATGNPIPKVSIQKEDGRILISARGFTALDIPSVSSRQAGKYFCVAEGFKPDGRQEYIKEEIRLSVYKSPGSVAAAVLVSLILCGLFLALGIWLYKTKFHHRFVYGRIPDNSVAFEKDTFSSSAMYNAQSIRNPAGGPIDRMKVENSHIDTTTSEASDEEEIEFSKESEFLV